MAIPKREIELTCKECGKRFVMPLSSNYRKFCSRDCYAQWLSRNKRDEHSPGWKGGKTEYTCTVCGNTFLRYPEHGANKYCSRECYAVMKSLQTRGKPNPNSVKHGMCGTPEYSTWSGMKTRCLDPNNKDYERYGAIGITVCDRWMDFENFYEDMGKKPKGTSLDRIDNDKGYGPENCRWATPSQQQNNRRVNIRVSLNGVERGIGEWAVLLGIAYGTLLSRYYRNWDETRMLNTPSKKKRKLS